MSAAEALAAAIAGFPQQCLRADRRSAIHQWDMSMENALAAEGAGGYPVVFEEAIEGAGRFTGGAGRHGAFTVSNYSNKPSETS